VECSLPDATWCSGGDLIHALALAAKGETKMQDALMLSLAASIMLGMWVIWRITP
jgi:hypothetical protein